MLFRRLVLCLSLALVGSTAGADEAGDACRLTIDGEVYNVPVGKAFAVMVGGKRVTMRLDRQTQAEFRIDGVEFAYPKSLQAAEPMDEGGVTIWSLEGPSAAVMLQRYDGEIAPESLLEVLSENIAQQYGSDAVERQSVQLRGAERSYTGQQLRVASNAGSVESELVQNVFTFASGARVYALIVQDTRAADEGETDEYRETLRLLGDTLKSAPAATRAAPAPKTPRPQRQAAPQPQRRRVR
ncbi:MAG: hypothetical protein AAFV43_06490 [Planctomycetota bacterium]